MAKFGEHPNVLGLKNNRAAYALRLRMLGSDTDVGSKVRLFFEHTKLPPPGLQYPALDWEVDKFRWNRNLPPLEKTTLICAGMDV
ncbi:MAG: hypothetical protein ACI8W8_000319 [Rhodothermales bacterium]|jgi:hypothetical protein